MQLSLYDLTSQAHTTTMIQSSSSQQITYFPPSNPSNYLTRLLTEYQELAPNSWSISSNSTSDEAEEHRACIHDERKQRRMISNRESARRSRIRKQRHLDELWSQVLRLRNENHCLIDKLNQMSESHDRVVRENARLKEEAAHLQTKLTNSYSIFTDLQHLPCTTTDLSSNQSAEDVLH